MKSINTITAGKHGRYVLYAEGYGVSSADCLVDV